MDSTITGVATIVVLATWHYRNRRHSGWLASADGRFFVTSGYPLVAVAVYLLSAAQTATAWEWALGNLWALTAMVFFVLGFASLNRATDIHAERAQEFETMTERQATISNREIQL